MNKDAKVFLRGTARERYERLLHARGKEAKSILHALSRLTAKLRENPQHGQPMGKRLIPAEYTALGVQNLYRAPLPAYWRALYTIESDETSIYVFILFLGDHKEYDALLGYRDG